MKKLLLVLILLPLLSLGQTWTTQMDSLAKVTEKTNNLPHGICRAFALQESNYNQYAVRAEGNYIEKDGSYARGIRASAYKFSKDNNWQPSFLTEVVQRGESWTMWQLMGDNLRDLGFSYPFFQQDLSLPDQFKYFSLFISKLLKKNSGNIAYTASEYNGGSGAIRGGNFRNKSYVQHILKNIDNFKY